MVTLTVSPDILSAPSIFSTVRLPLERISAPRLNVVANRAMSCAFTIPVILLPYQSAYTVQLYSSLKFEREIVSRRHIVSVATATRHWDILNCWSRLRVRLGSLGLLRRHVDIRFRTSLGFATLHLVDVGGELVVVSV